MIEKFVAFNNLLQNKKKQKLLDIFFTQYTNYYNFDLIYSLPAFTDCHALDATRSRFMFLKNYTDEHSNFEQILKTARMGSAMYSPLTLDGKFVGQFITASQARNTYDFEDFIIHQTIAKCASLVINEFGWEAVITTINN